MKHRIAAITHSFSFYVAYLMRNRNLFFAMLVMAFLVLISNYLVQFPINAWLTWGAWTYPFTFLVTELVNYFYGPSAARRVVWVGFVLATGSALLWMQPRIAMASGTAFLMGQWLDIFIFSRLRKQASWMLAPLVASGSASLLDSLLFFFLAFSGDGLSWMELALGDCSVKLLVDGLALFPFRMWLWAIRRA